MHEIYSSKYSDVTPCTWLLIFWRNLLPPSSGQKNDESGGGRFLQNVATERHGIMSQQRLQKYNLKLLPK
jgi:hypothetical protein